MALAFNAPEDCDPLRALAPDQSPDPVQAVAFCVDHVSVAAAPAATVLGEALKVTDGGNAETVTVADCAAEPPSPVFPGWPVPATLVMIRPRTPCAPHGRRCR